MAHDGSVRPGTAAGRPGTAHGCGRNSSIGSSAARPFRPASSRCLSNSKRCVPLVGVPPLSVSASRRVGRGWTRRAAPPSSAAAPSPTSSRRTGERAWHRSLPSMLAFTRGVRARSLPARGVSRWCLVDTAGRRHRPPLGHRAAGRCRRSRPPAGARGGARTRSPSRGGGRVSSPTRGNGVGEGGIVPARRCDLRPAGECSRGAGCVICRGVTHPVPVRSRLRPGARKERPARGGGAGARQGREGRSLPAPGIPTRKFG